MAINYKVTKCRNPKGVEGTDYFKGTVVKTSDYDFEDLVEDISLATTVTKGDAIAVLASIKPYVTKALLAGRRVVLQDLGSFHISLQGQCYTAEDMAELAVLTKRMDFHLEQVQDFTPTPMTVSTEAWYTGLHPYTLQPIFSAKSQRDKLAQRQFFFWYKPEMRRAIMDELRRMGRRDLIDKLFGR